MSEVEQNPPVHLLGTPAFFPALVAHIRDLSNSPNLPLDHIIVKSILLCLIAGDKHLILRTAEEDIGLVARLVVWTLSYVFNYTTHRVKIRAKSSSQSLLQSLFLSKLGAHGRTSRKSLFTPTYSRSASYTNDLSHARSRSFASERESSTPRLHQSWTEAATARSQHESLELPRAMVFSGIEKGSLEMQRQLSRVLSERRVSFDEDGGSWDLPSGFIAVYVCALNARERPAIHKSLLDKFSMSHNIFVHQSIRQALGALPFSPIQSASLSPVQPSSFSPSNPGSPVLSYHGLPPSTPPYFAPVQPSRHFSTSTGPVVFAYEPIPQSFIDTLQRHCRATHLSVELGLYLSDLFSATRHHACLDGMLLTATARKDAEDLARAARVIGSDLTGMELIRPMEVEVDDGESEYYDAQSSRHRPFDDTSTTNLIRKDSTYGSSTSLNVDHGEEEIPVLDVTVLDVAKMMPRVVTHRLSLRSSPEDEVLASAVVGATFGPLFHVASGESEGGTEVGRGYGSLTVKDVLVEILHKV